MSFDSPSRVSEHIATIPGEAPTAAQEDADHHDAPHEEKTYTASQRSWGVHGGIEKPRKTRKNLGK